MKKSNLELVYEALLEMTDDDVIRATSLLQEDMSKYESNYVHDTYISKCFYSSQTTLEQKKDTYEVFINDGNVVMDNNGSISDNFKMAS